MSSFDGVGSPKRSDNGTVTIQAKAGSIAAIIQLLNESLAHLKVRTRALLEGRKLLLLCESEQEDNLDAESLVPHVRQILEAISPPNIRRVCFFSRLVREEQLLWTKELADARNPHILWSEEIVLKRPNPLKVLGNSWQKQRGRNDRLDLLQDVPRRPSQARPVWPDLLLWGSGGLGILMILGLFGLRGWHLLRPDPDLPEPDEATSTNLVNPPTEPLDQAAPIVPDSADPFAQAVRIAESAALDGKAAVSRTNWLDLAYRWQQASDLMGQVPPEDDRYGVAQDRVEAYRRNSEAALAQANQL